MRRRDQTQLQSIRDLVKSESITDERVWDHNNSDSEKNSVITAETIVCGEIHMHKEKNVFCYQDCNNLFHCVLFHMNRCLLTKLNASRTKADSTSVYVHACACVCVVE